MALVSIREDRVFARAFLLHLNHETTNTNRRPAYREIAPGAFGGKFAE